MGWFGEFCGSSLREIKHCIEKGLERDEILEDGSQFRQKILLHSFKYGESYIALQQVKTSADGHDQYRKTFAVITLWRYSKKDMQLMLKTMDETCGPHYYKAPLKLIKLLDPPVNDWAHNWRVGVCSNFKRGVPEEYLEYREEKKDVG